MMKRLFIFAGYDKDGIIDDTLLYYLNSLSEFGDIIFIMDNDVSKTELKKLSNIKNILHADAMKHNEYDFGSYKRGYLYAYDNKLLDKYDWVYFANDSVYGPLWNLKPILEDLESKNTDMTGLFENFESNISPHIQSWFIGLKKNVVNKPFFYEFMKSVCHEEEKTTIVLKYEVRLSRLILQNGYTYDAFCRSNKKMYDIYKQPLKILEQGIPFIKKQAVKNIDKVDLLYQHTTKNIVDIISKNAFRNNIDFNTKTKDNWKYKYQDCFRITFLSIPLIKIYKKINEVRDVVSYKVYLFDKIPIIKMYKKNNINFYDNIQ